MKKTVLFLFLLSNHILHSESFNKNSTTPFDFGFQNIHSQKDEFSKYHKLSGWAESIKRSDPKNLSRKIEHEITKRLYTSRVKNAAFITKKASRTEKALSSVIAGLGASALQMGKGFISNPRTQHALTLTGVALGVGGGLTSQILLKKKEEILLKEINELNAFYQMDDATLHHYILKIETKLKYSASGLPHPFIDSFKARLHPSQEIYDILAIAKNNNLAEGIAAFRTLLKGKIYQKIQKLRLINQILTPLSIFLITTGALSVLNFPSTLTMLQKTTSTEAP